MEKWQQVEAPWPLEFSQKSTQQRYQGLDNAKIWRKTQGGRGSYKETRREPQWTNPPGDDRALGKGQGRHRRKRTGTGYGGRLRHMSQGLGTSGGVWRVAGEGNAQGGGASYWERRWELVETGGLWQQTATNREAVVNRGKWMIQKR